MSPRRSGTRRVATAAAWLAIAALAALAIAGHDVSLAIGAGVAAVWALCFGFFPAQATDRL